MRVKIITALLLACLALFLAWGVSRTAFNEMLETVENISAPSERLRLVNVISRRIGGLEQLQRLPNLNVSAQYSKGFKASRELRIALDSLGVLYKEDTVQLSRISAIKKLLSRRDKQFVNYLRVRAAMMNDKAFSEQVRDVSDMVNKRDAQSDSTILAREQKTSTTTVYPTDEKPRSFFGRIFGRKRPSDDSPIRIVSEEKVVRDTIAVSAEDSLTHNLERSLQVIAAQQRKQQANFLGREAELAVANEKLIGQMVDVLSQVEAEVVSQIEQSGFKAKGVVNTSIRTISIIFLVFVFLMAILLYFILTDLTRSKRYRAELEKAKEEAEYHGMAKQRFLANMSHEIRTPLQSIIGYADLIRNEKEPKKSDIEAIHHSSEHLLQIVNEILDYNRITSGKFSFASDLFDMRKLLDEVMSVMRLQSDARGLTLSSEFQLEPVRFVYGDPFRLKQILYNLLGNAVKFTPKGEVKLKVFFKQRHDDLYFTFVVADTGVGMTEAETQIIFNEFEQAGAVDGHVANRMGTGLGLSIIKSLIEQQGGRIYVKSRPGAGSVFTVYLTFRAAAQQVEIPDKPEVKVFSEGKVWLVDDDPLILDLFSVIFERHFIPYKRFDGPLDMLNEAWDERVKHVFIDIRMPGMDGITLCKEMRKRITPGVKLYAVTAQVLPDERELLLASGFDHLVMKPFRESEIIALFTEQGSPDNSPKLDLTALRKMTYGDEEQLRKILTRFVLDSRNDIAQARLAIEAGDTANVRLIVHRIAGRTAQIGAAELAAEFRRCEIALTEGKEADIVPLLQGLDRLCDKTSQITS
ncbi:ATP-binding protein [Pedobacter deserti]|uniref:ATP-binding protein n=1 Tax=Pedobacter deserti TaxID=2817382 RepID=UPI00210CA6A5|nr:ATP-binding protein [Pedobacter sp. SYSU D00382]